MKPFLLAAAALLLTAATILPNAARAQTRIGGTVQVHPAGKIAQYDSLTFLSGHVVTPRALPGDNISFRPGSHQSGASDASHVNGYAEKVGSTAFTFPVGSGTRHRPAGISAPGNALPGTTGTFRAAYYGSSATSATLPTGAPFGTTSLGAGVKAVSTVEYWDIDGAGPVAVTLSWDAASDLATLTGNTPADLLMVGWNGTQWVDLGTPTPTGTLGGTGTLTVAGITPDTYAAYTFGSKQSLLADCNYPAAVISK